MIELKVSRLDMTQKIFFSKYPVPVVIALKLSGIMKLFHYAYRFCGSEIWTGPIRDRASLLHNVWDLTWADLKAGDGGFVT